jgi:DNA-binding LacI/PurR family transcriptional regulator
MMLRDPEITAIACYNDPLAMGAYQALQELKIIIPDQVSVVGFDDLELISGGLRPGLTTVRLPHYQMGREAVEKLIYGLVAERGGSISAEHGIGLHKKIYLNASRSTAEIDAMRAIKRALDPLGLLNPGKIFDAD